MTDLIGKNLGQYEIQKVLGHGGMATVYIGYQSLVDRKVAVKVLPPHPGLNEQFTERFQLEAKTIAKLQHPHILQLFDYGITADKILYLVMPYVDGGSLDRYVSDGPMDLAVIERLLRDMASAMDYAHRQGVVHRDIKPANIILDGEGNAFVADFGIAKIMSSSSSLTGTGVVGTPAYMSPEQAQGLELDARSDIYSLGVVVFEMLTGRPPYESDTPMQVVLKHISAPVPSLLEAADTLPPALEHVMRKVLAKEPTDRYQTASAFAEAFSSALHKDESLLSVRREQPLNASETHNIHDSSTQMQSKPKMPTSAVSTLPLDLQRPDTGSQTIIVQQGLDSRLILGGFIILAALILGVVVVLTQMPNNQTAPDVAGNATAAATNEAVDVPTGAPDDNSTGLGITVPDLEGSAALAVETVGEASFLSTNANADTINLRVQQMRAPGSDRVYVGWLRNTRDDIVINIGRVALDAAGNGALVYTDTEGRFLPIAFNRLIVTLEELNDAGDPEPSGAARYEGGYPIEVSDALSALFIESEQGDGGRGLLASALREAKFAKQHAGLATTASNLGGLFTHAEHTMNIILGGTEDFDNTGSGSNPGTGAGLEAYLLPMAEGVENILSAEGADVRLQSQLEVINVCLQNVAFWATEAVNTQLTVFEATDVEAAKAIQNEVTTLTDHIVSGFDQNENNSVEPTEFECGLEQLETFGLLVANIGIIETLE